MVAESGMANRTLEEGRQILLVLRASVGSLVDFLGQLHRNPSDLTDQILHSNHFRTLVHPVLAHTLAVGSSLLDPVGWTYPGEVKVDEVGQGPRSAGMAYRQEAADLGHTNSGCS